MQSHGCVNAELIAEVIADLADLSGTRVEPAGERIDPVATVPPLPLAARPRSLQETKRSKNRW